MFSDEYRVEYYTKNAAKYIDVQVDKESIGDVKQDEIFATNISSLIAFKNDESKRVKFPFWFETNYIDDIIKYFQGFTESVGRGKSAIFRKDDVGVLRENALVDDPSMANVGFYALFGDSSEYAAFDSGITIFSKVRPIGIETRTVLLKLQCTRHYGKLPTIPEIDIPYEQKLPKLFWRGISTGCNFRHNMREVAVTKFQRHHNSNIDIKFNKLVQGISGDYVLGDWHTVEKQLKYKYLLSIEGNDVATNLKWIMMSNSVCIMPIPQICSWFMEDHLVPYVHFVPVSEDFSDLEEVYEWCLTHDEECEEISKNATEFAKQFLDLEREDEITRKVIARYFSLDEKNDVNLY
jgi:hypothetical protein